jgi:drug/metabolite transporter (DMT)-like permease
MASIAHGTVAPGIAVSASRPGSSSTDLLLVLMALIWGINFSVVKYGTQVVPPLAYNALRVALAALILLGLGFALRRPWPSRRDVLALLALGVLGNCVYQIFFIEGLARTRAGTAALVLASGPAFVALVGRIRGIERITARGWVAIGLQLAGMACVVAGTKRTGGDNSLLGSLLILSGALCWALFSVQLKPYTHRMHGIHLSALTMLGGAVPLALVATPSLAETPWGALGAGAYGAVAYSGLLAMVVAYLIYYRGVRVIGPTRTAMYGNLQPIIALGIAWLMLGETPTIWQIVGMASILSGLLLSRS